MEKIMTGENITLENRDTLMREIEILETKLAQVIKDNNQFTYIITHDLQAPLRMVTGFLELLEKKYADNLDDQGRQYIGYATRGSVKMKNLIFDLLEYSRLSSVEYLFEATCLEDILNEVRKEMSGEIESSGTLLHTGPLPVVFGNSKLLRQLFRHLVSNAIKFRGESSPVIHISAEEVNGRCIISITDNGMGIDPAFFEKIFTVFRKLHTDEIRYPGTGIGLAICKKIAELHQGQVEVESVPGKGSTFRVTLPLA
jgi:light-regulated signal transduction histidine kinase (bacteriophytochrome)